MSAAFAHPGTVVTGLGNQIIIGDLQTFSFAYHRLSAETLSSRSILSAFDCAYELAIVGSYNCETYVYDIRANAVTARLLGQQGGVIQVALEGTSLLTAGRKDNFILHWDLRNLTCPVNSASFYREHKTHQRVLFCNDGHWLGVGNSNGSVFIYDLSTSQLAYYFSADFDAVNSVQLHGSSLFTSSGQRHLVGDRPKSLIREWTLLELEP
jgi:WD40 repeat protein